MKCFSTSVLVASALLASSTQSKIVVTTTPEDRLIMASRYGASVSEVDSAIAAFNLEQSATFLDT